MLKKIISLGGITLALLAFAVPAMAYYMPSFQMPEVNTVKINSQTVATANTGGNVQANQTEVTKSVEVLALSASGLNRQTIITGNAYANASSLTIANADACGCGMTYCYGCMTTPTKINTVEVKGLTGADADSGTNQQANVTTVEKSIGVAAGALNLVGGSTIVTGNAGSNVSSRTLVNVRPITWQD